MNETKLSYKVVAWTYLDYEDVVGTLFKLYVDMDELADKWEYLESFETMEQAKEFAKKFSNNYQEVCFTV